MPGDKELEIKLKATGGEAAAAEVRKVETAVDDLGGASDKLGDALDELTEDDIVAEWMDRVGKSTTGAGDAAEAYEGHLASLLRGLSDLPGPMGEVAGKAAQWLSLGSSFGPYGAMLAAAGAVGAGGMKLILDKLDEIDAAANRALPTLERTSQAAAVEMSALEHATGRAAARAREAESAYDGYARQLRQIARDQAALTDAELGEELARIDLDELTKKLTEAEAIQARFDAQRAAEERKRAAETAAIETELKNRRKQNALDLETYRDTLYPAREAQARLDVLTGNGAMTEPLLYDEAQAVRDAQAKKGEATTTDPEELAALDKAIKDAQSALNEAFAAMVAEAIERRDAAVAATREAGDKYNAGMADERSLQAELTNQTSGPGAQAYAASRREAEIRAEIEQELLRKEQALDEEKRLREEEKRLREEAKRLRDEQMAAMQTEIQEDSHGLARKADIIDQRGYDDAAKLVDNIATGLAAGASKAELATALHRLGEEAEGAGSSLASMLGSVEASLTDFYRRINRIEGEYAARIARLESQTRANR